MSTNTETAIAETPAQAAADDLRAAAGVAGEGVTSAASKLKVAASEKAHQAKAYATEKAGKAKEFASEKAAVAKDFATEKAAIAKEKAAAGWDVSCTKAKDLHTHSEEYVRANPTKAILGAFGIGVVIGLIVRGK